MIQQFIKRIDTGKSNNWYWGFLLLFILINSYLTAQEIYYFPVLPLFVLILFSALVALDKLIFFILFFIPFSLTLEFSEFAALTVPTEPLLFGVMLVFFFRLMFEGGFDIKITKHPVTLAILFHLIWMFTTSLSSTMVLVSIKYFLARLWFVVSFYFLATQIFKNFDRIIYWIWLFTVPLSIVICYSIVWLHAHINTKI